MILALQRGILSGLIIETFNADEVNKRFELCEKVIPAYKQYFKKEQLEILRLTYRDAKKYQEDGAVCFGISEISEKMIIHKFPYLQEELIETLSTGAITEEMIPVYLKELENKMLEI